MVEPPSPGGATGAGHRGAYFAALLASSDALRLTSGTEGLGLALRRAAVDGGGDLPGPGAGGASP